VRAQSNGTTLRPVLAHAPACPLQRPETLVEAYGFICPRLLNSVQDEYLQLLQLSFLFARLFRAVYLGGMNWLRRDCFCILALILATPSFLFCQLPAPSSPETPPVPPAVDSLDLTPVESAELARAMDARDYVAAEKVLLSEIEPDQHSLRAARLLAFAGVVYFRDRDYIQAAIAWKKSDAIAPLAPSLRFSLAMAYIEIRHFDWSKAELERLADIEPANGLYPYWLGRLAYDRQDYPGAILQFQRAVKLSPAMARVYDNLGLCYYYQNQNAPAIENFKKAIAIESDAAHPSAWPYLNLAITEHFLGRTADAESDLRSALRFEPNLKTAHFQLGAVLEDEGRLPDALEEFAKAAALDASYAEPHVAMARIDHKLGREEAARAEAQIYLRLRPHSSP